MANELTEAITQPDIDSLLFKALGWSKNSGREAATTELIKLAENSDDIREKLLFESRALVTKGGKTVLSIPEPALSAIKMLGEFGGHEDAHHLFSLLNEIAHEDRADWKNSHKISDAIVGIAKRVGNHGIAIKLGQVIEINQKLRKDIAANSLCASATFLADRPEKQLTRKPPARSGGMRRDGTRKVKC